MKFFKPDNYEDYVIFVSNIANKIVKDYGKDY